MAPDENPHFGAPRMKLCRKRDATSQGIHGGQERAWTFGRHRLRAQCSASLPQSLAPVRFCVQASERMPPILLGFAVAVIPLSVLTICVYEGDRYARHLRRRRREKREREARTSVVVENGRGPGALSDRGAARSVREDERERLVRLVDEIGGDLDVYDLVGRERSKRE